MGSAHTGFETVSKKPSSEQGVLHARRAGAGRTLCNARIDYRWYAWSITRFRSSAVLRCAVCAAQLPSPDREEASA